jgi:hypothetical protein
MPRPGVARRLNVRRDPDTTGDEMFGAPARETNVVADAGGPVSRPAAPGPEGTGPGYWKWDSWGNRWRSDWVFWGGQWRISGEDLDQWQGGGLPY